MKQGQSHLQSRARSSALVLGAAFAGSAVILGAFGAHALKDSLAAGDQLGTWETAVRYQMWHALALLVLGVGAGTEVGPLGDRGLRRATLGLGLGTLLFSGSLYGISLDGPRWLGPITPLGGALWIATWAGLVLAFWRGSAGASGRVS